MSTCGGRSQFADEIRSCESLVQLRRVHAAAAASTNAASSRYICNLLVHMYGKLGSISEARRIFEATPSKNLYSWNIAMTAFAHNGHYKEALQLRHFMDNDGIKPDNFTFVSMLSSCAALRDLALGRYLHDRAAVVGVESHKLVSNVLIFMYGKCGDLHKAKEIFDQHQGHSSVDSWNSIITAYAENGHVQKVIELYEEMRKKGILPNRITLVCVLDAAASVMPDLGIRLHREAVECSLEHDTVVATALITMYGKCGRLDLASRIFNASKDTSTFMWNAMITAYAQNGHYLEALQLYRCPVRACVADEITFLCVLDACSGIRDIQLGRDIHAVISNQGLDNQYAIANAVLTMYAKCGSLIDAKLVFDGLESKSIVSWNAFLAAHSNNDRCRETLKLWRLMDLEGVQSNVVTLITVANACSRLGNLAIGKQVHERVTSYGLDGDLITCNGLVTMYGYCYDAQAAKRVFDSMKRRNVVSWSAMIAANAQNGHNEEAVDVYLDMNVEPDEIAFLTALDACSRMQNLEIGKQIHNRIVAQSGMEPDAALGNALITLYCRCSRVEDALQVFENMKKRNAGSWSAMAAAYAQNGHSMEALKLYERSLEQGAEPENTLLATALDACSSLGYIDKGRKIHSRIISNSNNCVQDVLVGNALLSMYGKCGSIESAQEAFHAIENKNVISWNAMITAYARHGHGMEAVTSFRNMDLEGLTPNVTTFSAVLVACSHSGLLEEGWTYFRYMTVEIGIAADTQHHGCMLDLLCRLGQTTDAQEFLECIPQGSVQWTNVLSINKLIIQETR